MNIQGNLVRVDHEQLGKLIKKSYKKRRSLFTWGTIGIGKSVKIRDTAEEIAKDLGLEFSADVIDPKKFSFMDIRLSQIDATDIKGIPFPNKQQGADATTWLLPDWLPRDPDSKGILFFDELNLAPPSIQASAYSLIQSRKIGNYHLPKGWICVSAGNRIQDKSHVFETPKALENRFKHCELLPPDADAWKEWALKNDIDKRIISYILWQPSKLMQFDPDNQDRADLNEKAFATPRTWEFASDDIKGESNKEDVELYVSTAVGLGTAMEFIAFMELRQDIPFEKIMKNPEKLNDLIPVDRHDLLYTFVTIVSEWYKKHYAVAELTRICEVAQVMREEFAILMLRYCKAEHEQAFKNQVKNIPVWRNDLSKRYGDYII